MADGFRYDAHHAAPPQRHDDPRTGRDAGRQRVGDFVDVGAVYRNGEDDRGIAHRRRTPSPGSVGSRIWPRSMVAPVNGSSTVSAAPSRSAASTSGVKCAAAVMPSEVSIMQPTMTSMPWARAVAIMRSASRSDPHLASLMLIPSTRDRKSV